MSEVINKIKEIVLSCTDNKVDFEDETESYVKFSFQEHIYAVGIDKDDSIKCKVAFIDEQGNPFYIDDALETLLTEKLNLEQPDFTIGVNKFAHMVWQFEPSSLETDVATALEKSDQILKFIVKSMNEIITDAAEQAKPAEQAQQSEQVKSSHLPVIEVIESAFKQNNWKYKLKERSGKPYLVTGFETEHYQDSDNDNSVQLRIICDNKNNEVTFFTPFLYNLFSDIDPSIDEEALTLRQAKLALLSLHMTSNRKFTTLFYDENDGEVRCEIRLFLDKDNLFSEHQTTRGVNALQEVVEKYHQHFCEGVMDANVSIEAFSKELFTPKSKKQQVAETLAGKISQHAENIEQLNSAQLDELAQKVASITQSILDEQASTD